MRSRLAFAAAAVALLALAAAAAAWWLFRPGAGSQLCRPAQLELGMASRPGDATAMLRSAPFGFRYQYLAGGLDQGWRTYNEDGQFARDYVNESVAAGICPVLTYYMILQSAPQGGAEGERAVAALADAALMRRYFEDLAALFAQLGQADGPAIVHFEPDLAGFAQQDGPPSAVPVAVAATGLPALAGLPDNFAGLMQAVVRLRDRAAPAVLLGYHASLWGNGRDLVYDASPGLPAAAGADAANFYLQLNARFDFIFAEFSDRDSGFKEAQYGDGGASWWTPETFQRQLVFLRELRRRLGLDLVLWQIPYGNTLMRAQDNTWNHYQDNKVQSLLGEDRTLLTQYRDAGVVALLFGRGADGATDASDANADGVTNPAPINGNVRPSLNADDDGGYFRERAAAYYGQPLRRRP